jgi:hypothetical protein
MLLESASNLECTDHLNFSIEQFMTMLSDVTSSVSVSLAIGKAYIPPTGGIEYIKKRKKR